METMNWGNLHKGTCPRCDEVLFQDKFELVKCGFCTFKIRLGKYTDLVKGKEASAYRHAVKRNQFVDKYHKQQKRSVKLAIDKQTAERESNLKRMKAKMNLSNGLLDSSLF